MATQIPGIHAQNNQKYYETEDEAHIPMQLHEAHPQLQPGDNYMFGVPGRRRPLANSSSDSLDTYSLSQALDGCPVERYQTPPSMHRPEGKNPSLDFQILPEPSTNLNPRVLGPTAPQLLHGGINSLYSLQHRLRSNSINLQYFREEFPGYSSMVRGCGSRPYSFANGYLASGIPAPTRTALQFDQARDMYEEISVPYDQQERDQHRDLIRMLTLPPSWHDDPQKRSQSCATMPRVGHAGGSNHQRSFAESLRQIGISKIRSSSDERICAMSNTDILGDWREQTQTLESRGTTRESAGVPLINPPMRMSPGEKHMSADVELVDQEISPSQNWTIASPPDSEGGISRFRWLYWMLNVPPLLVIVSMLTTFNVKASKEIAFDCHDLAQIVEAVELALQDNPTYGSKITIPLGDTSSVNVLLNFLRNETGDSKVCYLKPLSRGTHLFATFTTRWMNGSLSASFAILLYSMVLVKWRTRWNRNPYALTLRALVGLGTALAGAALESTIVKAFN